MSSYRTLDNNSKFWDLLIKEAAIIQTKICVGGVWSLLPTLNWSFLTLCLVKLFLVVQLQQQLLVSPRYHSFFIDEKIKIKYLLKKLKIFAKFF